MCTWNYEYWIARKGEWGQIARDRARFEKRIQDIGGKISYVFNKEHRQRFFIKNMREKDI